LNSVDTTSSEISPILKSSVLKKPFVSCSNPNPEKVVKSDEISDLIELDGDLFGNDSVLNETTKVDDTITSLDQSIKDVGIPPAKSNIDMNENLCIQISEWKKHLNTPQRLSLPRKYVNSPNVSPLSRRNIHKRTNTISTISTGNSFDELKNMTNAGLPSDKVSIPIRNTSNSFEIFDDDWESEQQENKVQKVVTTLSDTIASKIQGLVQSMFN
jgi:predicted XRE-type DNA-binding protein